MLFDAQLQLAQFEVASAEDHVQLALLIALSLPVGQGTAMPIPAGILRFPMSGAAAIEHGNAMVAAGEEIGGNEPEKASDLIVASSMAGVEKAVKQAEKLTGK